MQKIATAFLIATAACSAAPTNQNTGAPASTDTPATPPAPATPTTQMTNAEVLLKSGFEEVDLTPSDGSLFTSFQLQQPTGSPKSTATRVGMPVASGMNSMQFFAPPRVYDAQAKRDFCGKADVMKGNLPIQYGDVVEYSAWFYLTDPASEAFGTLMDIECTFETCHLDGTPGIRVGSVAQNGQGVLLMGWKFMNYFSVKKLPRPADAPPEPPLGTTPLPQQKWFKLALRVTLGKGDLGKTEVYLDDKLEISVVGSNIKLDTIESLDHYDSFQVGLTCNETGSKATTAYVDDVSILRFH